ncbi:hypothetical protein DAEQUDRAFT_768677 [Daedalea quercina L-15889]|uniref:F-box domain-containing protein n=1 Tax=Daedalea quercina L-15889 TaxID=1314783 RepID=A0A165MFI1_9APHY|nr:hypothetical protein DAEQUDRAFT_768677 [Daedalea quercina L-15889]
MSTLRPAQTRRCYWSPRPETRHSRLPDDVLDIVFGMLAQERARYGLHAVVASDILQLVCRRWLGIVINRSRLWETILIHEHSSFFGFLHRLALAGDKDLYIEIQRLHPSVPSSVEHYLNFAEHLRAELDRIKTFKILGFDAQEMTTILQVFSTDAPSLEDVHAEFSSSLQPVEYIPRLFNNHMPMLRRATVVRGLVSFTSFTHLRSLHLLDQRRLKFDVLMAVLERNPCLEDVFVRRERRSRWTFQRPFDGTVSLPHLQELKLEGFQGDVLLGLSPLEFPTTTRVSLTLFDDSNSDVNVPQDFDSMRTTTGEMRSLDFAYKEAQDDYVLAVASPDKRVSVSWVWERDEENHSPSGPGVLFDLVDLRKVTELTVTELPSTVPVDYREWRRFLGLVPALQVLNIEVPGSYQAACLSPEEDAQDGASEPMDVDEPIIQRHFISLCAELSTKVFMDQWDVQAALHCQELRTLASSYSWILSEVALAEYAKCAQNRTLHGGLELSLGYRQEVYGPEDWDEALVGSILDSERVENVPKSHH